MMFIKPALTSDKLCGQGFVTNPKDQIFGSQLKTRQYLEAHKLEANEEALVVKRQVVAKLKADCKALSEKVLAVSEERADQEWQEKNVAAHLFQAVQRSQQQIESKTAWAQYAQEKCAHMRIEERRLHEIVCALEAETQKLSASCMEASSVCSEDPESLVGNGRWRRKFDTNASRAHLTRVREAKDQAEADAMVAANVLAKAQSASAAAEESAAIAEQIISKDEDERLIAYKELEDEIATVADHKNKLLRQIKLWCKLHESYMRQAEDNDTMTCAEVAGQMEMKSLDLLEEHQRSVTWRKIAAVSPVLSAWLVSAWWIVVLGR